MIQMGLLVSRAATWVRGLYVRWSVFYRAYFMDHRHWYVSYTNEHGVSITETGLRYTEARAMYHLDTERNTYGIDFKHCEL